MGSQTKIAVGQVWVGPDGLAYTVDAREALGWRVSVARTSGKWVGASTEQNKPWFFLDDQFLKRIAAKKLALYNEKAATRIDGLATRLEQRGKTALASALDQISQEYTEPVEAMRPARTKQVRVKRAARQLESLKREIKDVQDPQTVEEMADQIKNAVKTIQKDGPRVSPGNPISPPPAPTAPLKSTDQKIGKA